MGIRLILLAIFLWLLFFVVRRFFRQRKQQGKAAKPSSSVDMVACNHCGVHIPQDRAIQQDGNYYCCTKHSRLGGKKEEK